MNQFRTLSVVVTEEINPKKLPTFIQTQINLHNILTSKESYYYCSFIPEVLRYEIIIFREKKSIATIGVFFFSKLCEKDSYTLFILENLFCVYKKDKLLFVKQVSNTSKEDIVSYIKQTYGIIPSKIKYLENKDIQELINLFEEKSKEETVRNLHKVIPSKSFQYFVYYSLGIFIIFSFLIYVKLDHETAKDTTNILNTNQYSQEFITYNKHLKDNSIKALMEFTKYLESYNVDIKDIKYLNNKFELHIAATNKEILLQLLEYPGKKIELKSIQSKELTKLYFMDVIFHD